MNELFRHGNCLYIDIESPFYRNRAENATRVQNEKELAEARLRECEVQRMGTIRKAFNIQHGFLSDAVPFEVIEYLNDLHSDVQQMLTIDSDPYYREKISSLNRRLQYHSKQVEKMKILMDSSEATNDDHALFATILKRSLAGSSRA